MIDLIDLQEAKEHLHVTSTHSDSDIQLKILQASAILFNYIKVDPDASPMSVPWAGDEVPFDIRAAVLLMTGELFLNREASTNSVLSETVKGLLHRWRDPAMA